MERGCWSSFQRSIMSSLLTVWSVAHNNDRIEVLMQRFVYFLIQPFHLHRDICLFWSCFAYGRCVDVCFSYGCMLNVFLQRRPGMPLGPRQSVWLQHLFDLGKSNTNAARTTNYCPVLDKATCIFPLYQIPERKGCNPEKKNELFITYRACAERSSDKEKMEIRCVLIGSRIFLCSYNNIHFNFQFLFIVLIYPTQF